jgi:cytochrome c
MKLKFLFLGVAMIGFTSFSKTGLEEKYVMQSAKSSLILQTTDGQKLIEKADCIGCHNKDKKVIGPSYLDIANKYKSNPKNISLLADKIIKGGTDVWGKIPMTPHLTIKKEEAKKMVTYILSLKAK